MGLEFYEDVLVFVAIAEVAAEGAKAGDVESSCSVKRAVSVFSKS
jgi:hypothetical protein